MVSYTWTLRVLLLSACFAFASFVLALSRGAIGVARMDDWSYLSVSSELAESGELRLNGWIHMFFVVQGLGGSLIGQTLGTGIAPFQVAVLAFGAAGLIILFWLSYQLIPRGLALVAVAVTAMSPLLLYLSATFMTDVLAWTLSLGSIMVGVLAVRAHSPPLLVLASTIALASFGIREIAAVPFFVVLGWLLISERESSLRRWCVVVGISLFGICLSLYLWRQSLPGAIETQPVSVYLSGVLASRLLVTLGLLLSPFVGLAVIWTLPRRAQLMQSLKKFWLGAGIGGLLGVCIAGLSSLQLAGNVIHPYGSSWTSVGDGVRSLPAAAFEASVGIGIIGLIALCVAVGVYVQRSSELHRRKRWVFRRAVSGLPFLYLSMSGAIVSVHVISIFVRGAPSFDRYLILVTPLTGIVILWVATKVARGRVVRWQKAGVGLALCISGAFGVVIADGLNQVDGLRWKVASELAESGIPAYKIDGGDAWFRYHQKDAPGVAQVGSLENSIPGRTWWQTFFEGSTFCRMVAIESETDLQAMYGPALSIQEERTLLGTPFRVMVFPGPDPC